MKRPATAYARNMMSISLLMARRCMDCPLDATHVVLWIVASKRWGLFRETTTPTHCLGHAGEVMERRNRLPDKQKTGGPLDAS